MFDFPRPRVCRSLRRLAGWPVSRSTIGRSYGMPRNVKVVQTFKQLVKSSQLARHGAWQPETSSVSTPAARRPGGAKPGSNRISCLPRARHPYYAARRPFCQKTWMEMKRASSTREALWRVAHTLMLSCSLCTKGEASLSFGFHNSLFSSIISGVNINRIPTLYSLIDFSSCALLSITKVQYALRRHPLPCSTGRCCSSEPGSRCPPGRHLQHLGRSAVREP